VLEQHLDPLRLLAERVAKRATDDPLEEVPFAP
jgi:hypothetical protein